MDLDQAESLVCLSLGGVQLRVGFDEGGGENCTRAKDCEHRGVSQGQAVKKLERFLFISFH